jgi:AcrR family transcriptional regulator
MADQAPRVTAPAPRRRGPASTEDGQRSRDRVLRAAVELITEAGIDRVRVAEIARRASMSSGQVMYYFTSKEHILLETLAWRDHQDIRRTRAALAKANRSLAPARTVHRPLPARQPSGPELDPLDGGVGPRTPQPAGEPVPGRTAGPLAR